MSALSFTAIVLAASVSFAAVVFAASVPEVLRMVSEEQDRRHDAKQRELDRENNLRCAEISASDTDKGKQ